MFSWLMAAPGLTILREKIVLLICISGKALATQLSHRKLVSFLKQSEISSDPAIVFILKIYNFCFIQLRAYY